MEYEKKFKIVGGIKYMYVGLACQSARDQRADAQTAFSESIRAVGSQLAPNVLKR